MRVRIPYIEILIQNPLSQNFPSRIAVPVLISREYSLQAVVLLSLL
jgi:hypothetical protein